MYDALGLTDCVGAVLSDDRGGRNTQHLLAGLLPQSVFDRPAGYEDANDAERLAHDPASALSWIAVVGSPGARWGASKCDG